MNPIEDRAMEVQPSETVQVGWIPLHRCTLASKVPLTPEAVEKKWRKLLHQDQAASWPPIVGHWRDGLFHIDDGRHEFAACLMRGRSEILAAWIVPRDFA